MHLVGHQIIATVNYLIITIIIVNYIARNSADHPPVGVHCIFGRYIHILFEIHENNNFRRCFLEITITIYMTGLLDCWDKYGNSL